VRGGYDALPEMLARPLAHKPGSLRLSAGVTDIGRSPFGVDVSGRGTFGGPRWTLRARAALVTVPLGVLRARAGARGAIRFHPELPLGKREAIKRLSMGRVIKVVVRFEVAIGAGPLANVPTTTNFLHAPRSAVPTWWVPSPLPSSCLVGWIAGPGADRFADAHDGPYREPARAVAAIGDLGRALGLRRGELDAAVEDVRVFDWGEDPWARGAYSWIPEGAGGATAALAATVGNWLFFAGEATHAGGEPGTVHGALESGARAARQISQRFS
jgi:monoamine oxidase